MLDGAGVSFVVALHLLDGLEPCGHSSHGKPELLGCQRQLSLFLLGRHVSLDGILFFGFGRVRLNLQILKFLLSLFYALSCVLLRILAGVTLTEKRCLSLFQSLADEFHAADLGSARRDLGCQTEDLILGGVRFFAYT